MHLDDNSVDANNNLTEMNLVNDVTGISQMASQAHDFSQVTLTHVNPDQTASQVLIDDNNEPGAAAAYGANRLNRNAAHLINNTHPPKKIPALNGGTGGPPDKEISEISRSGGVDIQSQTKITETPIMINENSS